MTAPHPSIEAKARFAVVNPPFFWLRMGLSAGRLPPHLALMAFASCSELVKADLTRWAELNDFKKPQKFVEYVYYFVRFMTFTPEFRNLFYLRTGKKGKVFSWLCPRLSSLDIAPTDIGPGLFIQHGEGTFVSAQSIGANCWIGRQVVIGFSNAFDRPTIGDNVRIFAGAKIIGDITVGNNATIGLNTVITENVAANVTMLGVPGKIIWRNNVAPTPQ